MLFPKFGCEIIHTITGGRKMRLVNIGWKSLTPKALNIKAQGRERSSRTLG